MPELKRIITKEEQEKKKNRRNFLIGIVLVGIMLFSTAAYAINVAFSNQGTTKTNVIKYKGINFVQDNSGYWTFEYNGLKLATKYNPVELNQTKVVTGLSIASYKDKVVYYEFNETQAGAQEVIGNLWDANRIPKRVTRACLSENCSIDAQVKSCSSDTVISFRTPIKGEDERVYSDQNCVFIVANETDQAKYSDAFLYNLLGI